MEINQQDILDTVRSPNEKNEPQRNAASPVMPTIVKDALRSSDERRAGVSLLVSISYESISGNLKNRDFLIRRIVRHRGEYYIDGLASDIRLPRLIKVDQISFIREKASQKGYSNPYRFLQEVLGVEIDNALLPEEMSDFAKAIKETGNELTVLMYLVAIDGVRSKSEREKVLAYIKRRVPYLEYDEDEMNEYLISLAPDEDSFSMAFHKVLRKGIIVVQPLIETVIEIIMADGEIHAKERALLARIIDLLKQAGYEFQLPE